VVWAGSLRKSRQMNEQRAVRLVHLLDGPCVPPPGAPVGAAAKVTPEAMLASVDRAFEMVQDVLTALDEAWRDLPPRLARVTGEADRLARDQPGLPSVAAERVALAALPRRLADDPLGAAEELQRIEAGVLAAAQARAEATRHLRDSLAAAADTLADLEVLVDEGRDGLARCRAELAGPPGLLDPVDPAVLAGERGLRPWLTRLERLVDSGETALAATGLDSWWRLAEPTLATARTVAAANVTPVRRRGELAGLLRAARAKAGTGDTAGDPGLEALADRAVRALTRPCDLEEAEARVHDYLDELRHRPAPPEARWQEVSA